MKLLAGLPGDLFKIGSSDDELAVSLVKMLRKRHHSMKVLEEEGSDLVWKQYALRLVRIYREKHPEMRMKDLTIKIFSELVWAFPSMEMGTAAEQAGSDVFYYTLDVEAANGNGPCHAVDIGMYFGVPLGDDAYGKQFHGDAASQPHLGSVSETMMDAWSAFAKSGNPSCERTGKWAANDRLVIGVGNTDRLKTVSRDLPTYQPFLEMEREAMSELNSVIRGPSWKA